ncbi:hypothetical protein KJ575_00140 [Patescibacteria group bacterium]|nr:hypothetical protein [Patescibacteria group bacterium]MBU4368115.1 hypothetical protein [Patescibacteria group bacterium]
MPENITLAKTEYKRLRNAAERYEILRKVFELDFFAPPSTTNARQIIKEFRATGLYSESFLKSLLRGLKESRYFSKTAHSRNK